MPDGITHNVSGFLFFPLPQSPLPHLSMNRSKIVAIITGAISILLALAYLLLVQLLDFRGEMIPAPVSQLPQIIEVMNYEL